jgi:hypothetical protein
MSVSNWLPRPRVRLFIRWLQGICTPGVVRLRRVVTRITSGVCEQVHSILRRTLYYIKNLIYFSGPKNDQKMIHNWWIQKKWQIVDPLGPLKYMSTKKLAQYRWLVRYINIYIFSVAWLWLWSVNIGYTKLGCFWLKVTRLKGNFYIFWMEEWEGD